MHHSPSINRRAEIRQSSNEIDRLLKRNESKILLSFNGHFMANNENQLYFSYQQLISLEDSFRRSLSLENNSHQIIYLGEYQTAQYFVIQLAEILPSLKNLQQLDLRSAALATDAFDANSLFYSQGLLNWHSNHPFCAKCGSETEPSQSGHSRVCTSTNCAVEHFPRIEPAVIFSVTSQFNGVNKLLLARQANWPDKRYSVLAGFAEHGESLELSVKREAYEEVGLDVVNIQYVGSQPWPFPASLMLGFSCETKHHEIRLIDQELEQANWFSANDIKESIENGTLLMPFSISISWQLINNWYKAETGRSISDITKFQ